MKQIVDMKRREYDSSFVTQVEVMQQLENCVNQSFEWLIFLCIINLCWVFRGVK